MHVVFYSGSRNSICNKATILHYTKEKVEKTPIVLPSIVEQKSIVNYLDAKCSEIDALLQNYEDMPAKGGRPCTEKRAKRVFRKVQGDCPAGVWGSAPYNLRISYSPQYFHGGRRLI